MRRLLHGLAALLLAWSLEAGITLGAMPASETLLSPSTKLWLSIGDTNRFSADFDKTQLGQLWDLPAMEPFRKSLRAQLRSGVFGKDEEFGMTWEDLVKLAGGEVCFAWVYPDANSPASLLLMDVTGHRDEAVSTLDRMWNELTKRGAKLTNVPAGDVNLAVFRLPPKEARNGDTVVFFLHPTQDVLCIAESVVPAQEIAARLSGKGGSALANDAAFSQPLGRCQKEAGEAQPHLRWFCEPFGYAELSRARDGRAAPRQDFIQILREQGFDAIKGVGGYVHFATERHDIRYHLAVHAAGAGTPEDSFHLAARMLNFPDGGEHEPPAWVPRDLATARCFNWGMRHAFEAASTLVDAVAEEKIFEETLETIRTEPNTAQIDIRGDLISNLGRKAIVLSDHLVDSGQEIPLTESERVLFAAEITNLPVVTALVDKQMASDRNARRKQVGEITVWELVPDEDDADNVDGVLPGQRRFQRGGLRRGRGPEQHGQEPRVMRSSAVAVAHGHLLVASHVDFLERLLTSGAQVDSITTATDYQRVMADLAMIEPTGKTFLKSFSRTDEDFRLTYELIKQGQMPKSEAILGRLINRLMGHKNDDVPRPQEIDGSSLPDFEVVRPYLGPSGTYGTTEPDGWFFSGFILKK